LTAQHKYISRARGCWVGECCQKAIDEEANRSRSQTLSGGKVEKRESVIDKGLSIDSEILIAIESKKPILK